MNIYLATSWRNLHHADVLQALRNDGHHVYNFKEPEPNNPGNVGFSWRQINGGAHGICKHCNVARAGTRATMGADGRDCSREVAHEWMGGWSSADFCAPGGVLDHPIAASSFGFDMTALENADACVLVEPCGRSAHLELGYAVGKGKLTVVYIPDLDEPELMLRMCDYVCSSLDEVKEVLRPNRPPPRWQRDVTEYDKRALAVARVSGPTPTLDAAEDEGPDAVARALYGPDDLRLRETTFSQRGETFPGPCRPFRHRECRRCGGCWRHGTCTCT